MKNSASPRSRICRSNCCRTPPRNGPDTPLAAAPFGFSGNDAASRLPQPANWASLTVAAQTADPESVLSLYRDALRLRRALPGWHGDTFTWLQAPQGVLAFDRGNGLRCIVNLSGSPYRISDLGRALLASNPNVDAELPTDTAVWLTAEEIPAAS